MSELLHSTPEEKPTVDRTHLSSELASLALSYGVYDASGDTYEITEHPDDEKWLIVSNN